MLSLPRLPSLCRLLVRPSVVTFCVAVACAAVIWLMAAPARAEGDQLRYPLPMDSNDPRAYYAQALVALALEETQADFGDGSFSFSDTKMERLRMEAELAKGERINALLLPGSIDNDMRFLRVSVPVDRGLLGYRIGLIRERDQERFSHIQTLGDLRGMLMGSGQGWQITTILQQNGLTTEVVPHFAELFRLLDIGRVDMLSRGATEVIREHAEYSQRYPALAIEKLLVLRLPLAFYLYVSPTQPRLYERLQAGLGRAVDNGRFFTLFEAWYRSDLAALRLEQRRVIDLTVPDPHQPTLAMDPRLRLPLRSGVDPGRPRS